MPAINTWVGLVFKVPSHLAPARSWSSLPMVMQYAMPSFNPCTKVRDCFYEALMLVGPAREVFASRVACNLPRLLAMLALMPLTAQWLTGVFWIF
jgi:ABC-type dipeptide/oligopeptide/nickel transport system ATPase component